MPRDDEAVEFWKTQTDIDPSAHSLGNKKDNFWEMGETGPCGPCTEIHYDRTPDKTGGKLVNKGTPEVIEIWNLVFIQFNRNADQKPDAVAGQARRYRHGLRARRRGAPGQVQQLRHRRLHADHRRHRQAITGRKYGGKLDDRVDTAYRVIADHLRMASFAITDGARPGNKKRDACCAASFAGRCALDTRYFDMREPFVCKLVPTLVQQMGGAFPELTANAATVTKVLQQEEAHFFKNIERGLVLFNKVAEKAKKSSSVISGKDAANLHTTYGFPATSPNRWPRNWASAWTVQGTKRKWRSMAKSPRETRRSW